MQNNTIYHLGILMSVVKLAYLYYNVNIMGAEMFIHSYMPITCKSA